MKAIFFSLMAALISYSFLQPDDLSGILQPGAKVEKLAGGFKFTEGPSSDNEGNVFFTDQPEDRIMKWSTTGQLSTFMQPSGRSNGLAFDKEGRLWSCADEKNELWIISPDKSVEKISSLFEGKPLNGPNDLWTDPKGGVYFTDPFYKRPWWDHENMPQSIQAVYYLSADHKKIIRLIDDLSQPNGIVGTPDGKKLFVADIKGNKTWSYNIEKDGSLSGKKLFCEMGSDGMTIDSHGNIYLTGNGVSVFSNIGKKIGNIEVPEKWTANVCFGGRDLKTLYITASTGFYSVKLKVKGTRG
ncbi:MAG TPA: SMP-30/gluconolactonase/LRE family protein [Bacteroidales bacterium]|nr:SMP-30/gluconolactonase/LRE family protein [Bacteroidales bacterium]